uniref:RNase H type-1 domain-containing protein n=1 Tax=Erpetoichthys calabaricus TaxID=27687 RepID=A0A8C4RHL1_ERPCA
MILQQEKLSPCHIYTDSWSVANGLGVWMPTWKKNKWAIKGRDVWGREMWEQIWEIAANNPNITVSHVDAHTKGTDAEALFNAVADAQTKTATVTIMEHGTDMAKWAHERGGHLGAAATVKWAAERGVALTIDKAREVGLNCETCQHQQKLPVLQPVMGHINRGREPGQIWQIDFIGPMPSGCNMLCSCFTELGVL